MLCVLSFWSEVSYKVDPYKECCVFCPSGVRFLIKGILIKSVVCLSFWSEVSYTGDPYKECCVFCPSGVRFLIKGILIKSVVCFVLLE